MDQDDKQLQELEPTELLSARLDDERTIVRKSAQSSHSQGRSEVHPTPPFTLEKAMQTQVLSNRYQLLAPIGRGGMSTIYRGQDLHMNRVVAIEVLREAFSTDSKFITRFQREAKAASALHHPNIVEVYDYGQSDGNYYIVMELIQGTDLRRYLRSRGVLDVNRAVIIAHDIALGLAAAHRRGIVHRDVKPQNILVGHDGTVKLTDFGIVSMYQDMDAKRLTTTGMTLGTIQYYAPEQALGEIVSPAADVYELGIVMYEMLTGQTPFDGDSPVTVAMQHLQEAPTPPRQLNSSIPPALEEIILHCLEKAPEKRFHDGSRLARALETLGDVQSGVSVPTTPQPPPMVINATPISSRSENSTRGSSENIPPGAANQHDAQPKSNDASHIPGSQFNQPGYAGQQLSASPSASELSHRSRPHRTGIPGVVRPPQRNSRFVNIMTIFITIATLSLLGLSIYLAWELGFIHIPFINNGSSPTAAPTIGTIPHLVGLDYQTALAHARQAGFNMQSLNNIRTGLVIQQTPPANDMALKGSTIIVEMGRLTPTPISSPTPTPKT